MSTGRKVNDFNEMVTKDGVYRFAVGSSRDNRDMTVDPVKFA
jgi:hypothetical protein